MNKALKARIVEICGTQIDFAIVIAEHEATVSRVIRGHRKLSAKEQLRWAMALGCDDPEKLFPDQGK
jgi:DNA-binding transcriptional regulator YdaS (Cro superfamily)